MLSHPPFAQKAAQFMMKTGGLGQFEDLQGATYEAQWALARYWVEKAELSRRIGWNTRLYSKSSPQEITSSKTHAGPEDARDCKCTVQYTAYRPSWLTE